MAKDQTPSKIHYVFTDSDVETQSRSVHKIQLFHWTLQTALFLK